MHRAINPDQVMRPANIRPRKKRIFTCITCVANSYLIDILRKARGQHSGGQPGADAAANDQDADDVRMLAHVAARDMPLAAR